MSANETLPAEREAAEQNEAQTEDYADTPEDAETIDSLDDLKADRDEEGRRLPEDVYVDELGASIGVLQPTQEETEDYIEPYFSDDEDVDNEHLAELFELLFPAFDSVSAEDINDMTTNKAQGLLVAILKRAERPQAVDLVRGNITDELIEQAEKGAKLQQAAEPGNR